MIDYCRNYLDCKLEDYRRIWYTLHTTQDAVRWPNLLIVSELLFSLPFTNSKVEKSFSHLKVIKSERRTFQKKQLTFTAEPILLLHV